jgi:DNA (cytosine-5)-methyltransferase 1
VHYNYLLRGVFEMQNSIELFSGTGGLALGLQQAGFNHNALYEWDKDSCDNIKANIQRGFPLIKHWNVFQTDVRTVNYKPFGTSIQLVAGGPPCQPFSLGGKHKAYNDNRDMFPEAVRAVQELRPHAFIFENVKGLLRKSFSSYFEYIILRLTYPDIALHPMIRWQEHLKLLEQFHTSGGNYGLKYNVVFRLLNAADYGVPQLRQRVIIVGFRSDLDANWSFPEQTHSYDSLLAAKWISGEYWDIHKITHKCRPEMTIRNKAAMIRLLDNKNANLPRWQTVRDAIADLTDPRVKQNNVIANHEYRDGAKSYIGHSGSNLDEPSKTLKAGGHGVPGGENMVVLDDGSVRYYTVRESARLQTFPDEYIFTGSWTESMRQIGNAVPVRLAYIIGDSVITQLERMNIDGKQGQDTNNRAV